MKIRGFGGGKKGEVLVWCIYFKKLAEHFRFQSRKKGELLVSILISGFKV